MSTTKHLIDAIADGDAMGIESSFNAAMAEKISVQLDVMRQNVAQNMFAVQEAINPKTGLDPQGRDSGERHAVMQDYNDEDNPMKRLGSSIKSLKKKVRKSKTA
jgi:hypothetical protein